MLTYLAIIASTRTTKKRVNILIMNRTFIMNRIFLGGVVVTALMTFMMYFVRLKIVDVWVLPPISGAGRG
jgi:hypothetical protein